MISKKKRDIRKKKTEKYLSAFKIAQKKNLDITKKNLDITFFFPKSADFWHKTAISQKVVQISQKVVKKSVHFGTKNVISTVLRTKP